MVPSVFASALKRAGLSMPVPEYAFAKDIGRRWRFDYAWPGDVPYGPFYGSVLGPVALEVEGGVWVQGRHTRGSGFVKDMEKYNEAAAQGWRILRVTPQRLCHPDTIDLIRRALDA